MNTKLLGLVAAMVVLGAFVVQETEVVSFRYLLPCVVAVLGVAALFLPRKWKR